MALLWEFLVSLPKMVGLANQFFLLGQAIYHLVKEAEDQQARKILMKDLVAATHKAVETGDTKDLENVFKMPSP